MGKYDIRVKVELVEKDNDAQEHGPIKGQCEFRVKNENLESRSQGPEGVIPILFWILNSDS